ncbi:hypothetical protein V7147_19540 [Bacillus sp. JJ1521]|uniref:hypothetical protein n=1 Tax=Bacillus sp. JJ1521 TaxID=3122957 RepID=UPI0030002839
MLSLAKDFASVEPFAILLPDEIYLSNKLSPLEELIDSYCNYGKNVIALQKVDKQHLKNYGMLAVEKKELERLY